MSETNFTPITLDFIEEINRTLKAPGANYKLKDAELTKETFENVCRSVAIPGDFLRQECRSS